MPLLASCASRASTATRTSRSSTSCRKGSIRAEHCSRDSEVGTGTPSYRRSASSGVSLGAGGGSSVVQLHRPGRR
eukprot:scaffold42738_cov65-Phaeocystis_antarctica.AAC.8